MKSALFQNRWAGKVRTAVLLLALGCCIGDWTAKAVDVKSASRVGEISALWELQRAESGITLITLHGEPTPVTVQPETLLAGMCVHCNLIMEIPAEQTAKSCQKCGCGSKSAECFVNKVAGKKGWADLLSALPKGTALLAEYRDPGKPASGLKRLTIDTKTALLPLKSAAPPSLEVISAAAKAVGGMKVELGDDGKRLLIHLKSDWSQDRETRLGNLLMPSGVEIAFPSQAKDTH